mgnify:FL=1
MVSEKKDSIIMSKTQIAKIYDTMGLDSETVALYQDAFQLKSKGGMKIRATDLAPVRVPAFLSRSFSVKIHFFFFRYCGPWDSILPKLN